jgi:energy-converting hydrogenase Eha subunit A
MGTNSALRDATDGIRRLFTFSMIFSYVVAIVVGIPLSIQSKRRQWRKLWQNSIAGFLAGLALGVVATLIISILSSVKWMDPYSPFISVLFVGLAGLLNMTALWPFIDHEF